MIMMFVQRRNLSYIRSHVRNVQMNNNKTRYSWSSNNHAQTQPFFNRRRWETSCKKGAVSSQIAQITRFICSLIHRLDKIPEKRVCQKLLFIIIIIIIMRFTWKGKSWPKGMTQPNHVNCWWLLMMFPKLLCGLGHGLWCLVRDPWSSIVLTVYYITELSSFNKRTDSSHHGQEHVLRMMNNNNITLQQIL